MRVDFEAAAVDARTWMNFIEHDQPQAVWLDAPRVLTLARAYLALRSRLSESWHRGAIGAVENLAARMAYAAGLGASEWEGFTDNAIRAINATECSTPRTAYTREDLEAVAELALDEAEVNTDPAEVVTRYLASRTQNKEME